MVANQVATGLALTLLGLGLSGLIGEALRRPARRPARPAPHSRPLRHSLRRAASSSARISLVYLSLVIVAARLLRAVPHQAGLIIRAVGDSHQSAHALGYSVIGVRYLCVMFGGACAGLAGGYLSLVYTPQWVENMTAGRGWIALALVVFSSWLPWRIVVGAYLFGDNHGDGLFAAGAWHRHPVPATLVAALSGDHRRAGPHLAEQGPHAGQHAGLPRQPFVPDR